MRNKKVSKKRVSYPKKSGLFFPPAVKEESASVNVAKKSLKRKVAIDGKTWTKYSISVWRITKTPEENKLRHPAIFPIELPKRLIQIFTEKGDTVLDPFLGVGTTVLAAKTLGRKGIGFEIEESFFRLAKERLKQCFIAIPGGEVDEPTIYNEDARNLLNFIEANSIDFVVTSPPYWDIHRRRRTADYKEARPYSELKGDLGNISDYQEFIESLRGIFQKIYLVLKPGRYCAVVVMDLRKGNKFYPFHIDIVKMMEGIGFQTTDIIIWDRQQEYNNLRPLGYPYIFIVNKVHEYILIFKKEIS